jgi:TolB-like protein
MLKKFWLLFITILMVGCALNKTKPSSTKVEQKGNFEYELRQLANELSAPLPKDEKISIAVLDFSDLSGNVSLFGKYVAGELLYLLQQKENVSIIERNNLEKILEEFKLQYSDFFDESTTKELGKIIGVDGLVMGTITNLENEAKISGRIISAETGTILSAASVTVENINEFQQLLVRRKADFKQAKVVIGEWKESDIVANGFLFQFKECRMINRDLHCILDITNLQPKDDDISIQYRKPQTKVYDAKGNEYPVTGVSIANVDKKFQKGGSGYQSVRKTIISNTTVETHIIFSGVHSQIKEISCLEINFGNTIGLIQFYDLEVKK